mmetsp:Transcript_24489/g.39286  ORF Transcript_24489/g.39286 Transcript_24489/m.39286 type:complete len:258 (-) Transcript_24489:683-1456(-)
MTSEKRVSTNLTCRVFSFANASSISFRLFMRSFLSSLRKFSKAERCFWLMAFLVSSLSSTSSLSAYIVLRSLSQRSFFATNASESFSISLTNLFPLCSMSPEILNSTELAIMSRYRCTCFRSCIRSLCASESSDFALIKALADFFTLSSAACLLHELILRRHSWTSFDWTSSRSSVLDLNKGLRGCTMHSWNIAAIRLSSSRGVSESSFPICSASLCSILSMRLFHNSLQHPDTPARLFSTQERTSSTLKEEDALPM